MELKTFKDLIDLTKNRIGELDTDTEIEEVIKGAINYCYQFEVGMIDKRVSTSIIPIINKVANLPDDLNSIETIEPLLSGTDRIVGNAILTDKEGSFNLVYSYLREPLINDTDIPDMSSKYLYLLTTYAAYSYYKKKKKIELSDSYYNEYRAGLQALENVDNVTYSVQDNYSSFGLGADY